MKKYETLMNGVKEDPNKLGDIPHSWMGKFNMVKMTVLPTKLQIQ